jgi:hypothetical protein
MTGPAFMIITAAMQVGGAALLRVVVPLCRRVPAVAFWAVTSVVEAVFIPVFAALGWWDAAGQVIAFLIAVALCWWSRRNRRDRAAKWLGAKSKALRDSLVKRARDLSQPRPVLAPGGAR